MGLTPDALHVHAAVDGEYVAGDVGGIFAGEEFDRVGDVFGLTDAGERYLGEDFGFDFVREDLGHVRFDVAGGDGVDGDAAGAHLLREGLGHGDHAAFGGGIVGLSGGSGLPDHGSDIDDPAPAV